MERSQSTEIPLAEPPNVLKTGKKNKKPTKFYRKCEYWSLRERIQWKTEVVLNNCNSHPNQWELYQDVRLY